MPITNDLRKTLTDPTPLYFAAGLIDKIREEAPDRIAAVRATDPKEVQERVSKQAKETQAKVSDKLNTLDTDIKKLREQAQHWALQGVGVAAEYAVKARETYDELADRGRGAVDGWRGGEHEESPQVTVEREPVKVAEPPEEQETPKTPNGPKGGPETTAAAGAAKAAAEDDGGKGGTRSGSTGTAGTAGASGTSSTSSTSSTSKKTSGTSSSTGRKTTTAKTNGTKTNGTKRSRPTSES